MIPTTRRTDRGGTTMARSIQTNDIIFLLERAIRRLEDLDGQIASDPKQGRDSSSRNAVISKDLLFTAHLCRKAETLVLDEYHSFKGEDSHRL
jgi:hypothetical protein